MNKTVFDAVSNLQVARGQPVNYVDDWLDCLSVLYQVALQVVPVKHGVFRFLIQGMNNYDIVVSFLNRRKFPYCLLTTIVDEYEIHVELFRLFYKMNQMINNGVRKSFDNTKSSV